MRDSTRVGSTIFENIRLGWNSTAPRVNAIELFVTALVKHLTGAPLKGRLWPYLQTWSQAGKVRQGQTLV